MAVYRLDDELWFPDPHNGEADGLVAVGGDLSINRLLLAYSHGFFPWYPVHLEEEPGWYCPLDRFVIFPNEIHVSHSMRTMLNKGIYEISFNQAFKQVIQGCSKVDGRDRSLGAWLDGSMITAYSQMHEAGYAVSVEVWQRSGEERQLIGGLYGIFLRGAFFGESMFSEAPSASKIALIALAQRLSQIGGKFIDCQFETPHLKSMGGRHIPYEEYMRILCENPIP